MSTTNFLFPRSNQRAIGPAVVLDTPTILVPPFLVASAPLPTYHAPGCPILAIRQRDVREVCYATRGPLSEAPNKPVAATLLRLVAGAAQGSGRAAPWAAPVHHLPRCRRAGGAL